MQTSRVLVPVLVLSFAFVGGCASRYRLEPTAEKPETVNGIPFETLVTPKCVLQVGTQSANEHEMLVRVRVRNKSEAAFDFDPASLLLAGSPEVLASSPLPAQDAMTYVKDLKTAADLHESRTKMESFQGIEALETLKGGEADASIDSANSQYRQKQKDAAKSREEAEALRKRIAAIESGALAKATLKSGDAVEGIVVFKSAFRDEGPVEIESAGPCAGNLRFLLKD